MESNLALDKMTLEEKIIAMESIWEDLCKTPENIKSPSWHKRIIEEREEQIQTGKAEFIDWETAKKNIREKI